MGLFKKTCRMFQTSGMIHQTDSIPDAPNPLCFIIEMIEQVGEHVVALIHYPNCNNYEGKKILLFLNTSLELIKSLKEIDPHFRRFSASDTVSPFARFEPTLTGWKAAIITAKAIL